ncbi:hypothetical protein [Pseudomonas sp. 65/3-MNA-CIBAN-0223]|uniref:hypothetical protein n=1 Tax=Pseudomonas sp. 65/3-MNA-CIBAN-0223 TaxID=3140476 RepID=UPI0033202C47
MLAKWVLVLMINGKAEIESESPSEALCLQAMAKLTYALRLQGEIPKGGCYVLTSPFKEPK